MATSVKARPKNGATAVITLPLPIPIGTVRYADVTAFAKPLGILDEARDFLARYVVAGDEQLDAMALYAAATHAMRCFVTIGRLFFWSTDAESGKTMAMEVVAKLSSNPLKAKGTAWAVQSKLAEANNRPEVPVPTLWLDEVSSLFGRAGTGTGGSQGAPIATILREGYKRGATDSRQVNGVAEDYSIFVPFITCGLRTAIPTDIRTRCVSIQMFPGSPARYFDVRSGEPQAKQLGKSLAAAINSDGIREEIAAFRARGIHRKMTARKLEVWEPLVAVAYVLGGQAWLNRAVRAFEVLALADSASATLSPRQQVLRDMANIIDSKPAIVHDGFVGGLDMADELARIDDTLYEAKSIASLCQLMADNMPSETIQKRIGDKRVRGHTARAITEAWEEVKPDEPDDSLVPEEFNPYEVEGDR